jgi:hypothetical protein
MHGHTRGNSGGSLVEELERRRLFASRVFFQDFDDPTDDWRTGPNRFIEPGGAAAGAVRNVVRPAVPLDASCLRGNWAEGFADPLLSPLVTPTNLRARFTNVAIGTRSRGVSDQFFLQHWVWFDAGVQAAPGNNIKFVQFDGGDDPDDFDWYLNLDTGNFDSFRLINNTNPPVVGGASPPKAEFSSAPGASDLIAAARPPSNSVAEWFKGRWHNVQVYVKLNTANNRADGVFRFWLDGIKVLDLGNVDFRNSTDDVFQKVLPLSMHGGDAAPPRSFGWQLDEVELWDGLPTGSPRVSSVFVKGSTWTPQFLNYLKDRAVGDGDFGFRIPDGAAQLDELPWTNLNQVAIRFDGVTQVGSADLRASGVNGANREITAFRYDGRTRTAQWTLRNPISADRLTLALTTSRVNRAGNLLDGEWANGADTYPGGNGTAGGDFRFRLNVLPGDVNRNGSVLADDYSEVKRKFFTSTSNPGTGGAAYAVYDDVDGSGSILADDFAAVKSRFFTRLPGGEPAAAATALVQGSPVSPSPRPRRVDGLLS